MAVVHLFALPRWLWLVFIKLSTVVHQKYSMHYVKICVLCMNVCFGERFVITMHMHGPCVRLILEKKEKNKGKLGANERRSQNRVECVKKHSVCCTQTMCNACEQKSSLAHSLTLDSIPFYLKGIFRMHNLQCVFHSQAHFSPSPLALIPSMCVCASARKWFA